MGDTEGEREEARRRSLILAWMLWQRRSAALHCCAHSGRRTPFEGVCSVSFRCWEVKAVLNNQQQ